MIIVEQNRQKKFPGKFLTVSAEWLSIILPRAKFQNTLHIFEKIHTMGENASKKERSMRGEERGDGRSVWLESNRTHTSLVNNANE